MQAPSSHTLLRLASGMGMIVNVRFELHQSMQSGEYFIDSVPCSIHQGVEKLIAIYKYV
jgi:hypothetical protein